MNKSHSLDLCEAERHLRQSDEIMARLLDAYGPSPLGKHDYLPFHTLTRFIIGQQLSAKAAGTIERRLSKIVPTPFKPYGFLSVPFDTLRTAGLSAAKPRYILELAGRVTDGRLNFDELLDLPDDSVIIALTDLPGIGRWTAEMFLIFALRRPDGLALSDAGLQRAVKMLYENNGEYGLMERVSVSWRPYRSVASWYLWKHLDVVS